MDASCREDVGGADGGLSNQWYIIRHLIALNQHQADLRQRYKDTHCLIKSEWTGLEPATPGVTGRYSNQLNYHSLELFSYFENMFLLRFNAGALCLICLMTASVNIAKTKILLGAEGIEPTTCAL